MRCKDSRRSSATTYCHGSKTFGVWAGEKLPPLLDQASAAVAPIVDAFIELGAALAEFAEQHWPKVEALLPVALGAAELFGGALADAVGFLADHMDILGPALIAVATGLTAIKAAEGAASTFTKLQASVTGVVDHAKQLNSNFDQFLGFTKGKAGAGKDAASSMLDTVRLKAMYTGEKLPRRRQEGERVRVESGGVGEVEVHERGDRDGQRGQAGRYRAQRGSRRRGSLGRRARQGCDRGRSRRAAGAVAQRVATIAGTVATAAATAATAALNFVLALNPVTLVVIAIVALVAALVLAYHKVDWFRAFVDKAFAVIRDAVVGSLDIAWRAVQFVFGIVATVIETYVKAYIAVIRFGFGLIQTLIIDPLLWAKDKVVELLGTVHDNFDEAVAGMQAIVRFGLAVVKSLFVDPLVETKDKAAELLDDVVGFFTDLPDRFADALSSLAETVAAPFKAMGQAIKDAWNDTVGGKGFQIPDVIGVPNRGEWVTIPEMHSGGLVPGPPGREVLRILEGGERVLSRTEVAQMRSRSALAPAMGMAGAGAPMIGNVELTTIANASADEVVDAINAKLGWLLTTRRDR